MDKTTPELELPGFRFHPTEEELLDFYLKKMVFGKKLRVDVIGFLNIYHHDPWELPGLSKIGEREWYFFVPRNRKQGNGGRPNRTTQNGFWKATGSDRPIRCLNDPKRVIGLKKTLVFYKGRAPRGCKTDWVMNEYRMPDNCTLKEDIVLCKIYRKATSLKVLEHRASIMEVEMKTNIKAGSQSSTSSDTISLPEQESSMEFKPIENNTIVFKIEQEVIGTKEANKEVSSATSSLRHDNVFAELQLPKDGQDWTQDPFWTQLHSPWLMDYNFLVPYANTLNF